MHFVIPKIEAFPRHCDLQRYKSLAPANPRLIYCSVTGFGQTGPAASRAGYDLMAQGIGGIMGMTGAADGPPLRVGVPISDIFSGVYAAVGILAALARRRYDPQSNLEPTRAFSLYVRQPMEESFHAARTRS